MNPQDSGAIIARRERAMQMMEALMLEQLVDDSDAIRTFRMTGAGIVLETRRMAQEKGRHVRKLTGSSCSARIGRGFPYGLLCGLSIANRHLKRAFLSLFYRNQKAYRQASAFNWTRSG